MSDISKISVDGTSYNIKDATARQKVENLETEFPSKVADEVESYLEENPPQGGSGSITEQEILNALTVYFQNNPVKDGENGVSPIIEVSEIEGGHRITITDATEEPKFVDILDGSKGDKGDKGVGIQSIEKTSTEGLVDTYTITFTDSSTTEFIVTNGKDGENSSGGSVSDEQIATAVEAYLKKNPVQKGDKGDDGVGIAKIEKTSTEDLVDTYTITFTDGNTTTFTVTNGKDGVGGEITEEQIASAIEAHLAENPIEGGVTEEQLNTAITDYLAKNPVTNIDSDVFEDMADEWIENIKIAGANLPIIFLEGDISGISKENAVPIKMRFVSQFKSFEETCTLKYQGTSSMSYPKKNFTMKLDNKHGVGWGKQKKYCLKANYIDHSHARNIVSARLWSQIVASRPDYAEMPELLQASPNNGAVDGFPIRVYLNETYQGLYTMNVPKGSWQFKMDDTNENHCILCGENYVSGCFRGSAQINGSDWSDELHDVVPDSVKTRWNEVINFVMNSTDEEFKANIDSYIDLQSLIDYYIFAYVSTGLDALGKNQIYYTYDGQKYYASMYDMDSTWGMYYNGQRFVSETYRMQEDYETMVNGRQGNLLYFRLAELLNDEIETRYTELRGGILSFQNILAEFEKFMSAITTEQYSEDTTIYSGIPSSTTNNIKQIRSYVPKRLSYVDSMIYKVNVESIQLNYASKEVYQEKSFTLSATLTPSNANNYSLVWSADNENVTVDNGKVTGVTVGTSVVTVTDQISGNSASCTVTVLEKQTQGGESEVSATAVYSLDESTEFNGTSDYIDTGVQLFDEDKDFTVFVEFENASDATAVNYGHNVLCAQIEQSPYYGFALRYQSGNIGIIDCSNYTSLGINLTDTDKHYLIISHKKGNGNMQVYNGTTVSTTINHTIGTHTQNVLLGAYYDGSAYGRFFKGTIHKCAIYDEVLSESDIKILLDDILGNITGLTVEDKTLNVNATKPIKVSVKPTVNTKYRLRYETSDDTIASVDYKGNVTGNAVGDTTITVTDELTGISGTATVTVAEFSYDVGGLGASVQSDSIVYALDETVTTDGSKAIDTDVCLDCDDMSFTVMLDFSTSGTSGWCDTTRRPLDIGNYYLAFASWNLALFKEGSGSTLATLDCRYNMGDVGTIAQQKDLIFLTHEAGSGTITAVSYSTGKGNNHGVFTSCDYSIGGTEETVQISLGGYIGEFRKAKIWNTALTEEEIASIYDEWTALYATTLSEE